MTITRKTIRQQSADSLRLRVAGTIDSNVSPPAFTVNKIKDVAIDDQRFRWAYLHALTANEWRLITTTDVPNGNITLQRNFTATPNNAAAVDVLGILNP